jgi:hypothetical protein
MTANPTFERTAASALRLLAVPSSLRSSAAAQRERWARPDSERISLSANRPVPHPPAAEAVCASPLPKQGPLLVRAESGGACVTEYFFER